MPRKKPDSLLREQLDKRLEAIAVFTPVTVPAYGWIRATREALGISRVQLARKLKMTPASVADLEANEGKGTITLASLKKVAHALGCEFNYFMPPKANSYSGRLRQQAESVARKIVARTELHMNLEAQGSPAAFIERRVQELEYESRNIMKAVAKYLGGSSRRWDLTQPGLIHKIHRDMLGEVWRWAGRFRVRNLNIGVPKEYIAQNTKLLCDDLAYWVQNRSFPEAEIAVRFHHRLVSIHPFPNGNGRLSRICADILMQNFRQPELKWGGASIERPGPVRKKYIAALVSADKGDLRGLLDFATSAVTAE